MKDRTFLDYDPKDELFPPLDDYDEVDDDEIIGSYSSNYSGYANSYNQNTQRSDFDYMQSGRNLGDDYSYYTNRNSRDSRRDINSVNRPNMGRGNDFSSSIIREYSNNFGRSDYYNEKYLSSDVKRFENMLINNRNSGYQNNLDMNFDKNKNVNLSNSRKRNNFKSSDSMDEYDKYLATFESGKKNKVSIVDILIYTGFILFFGFAIFMIIVSK